MLVAAGSGTSEFLTAIFTGATVIVLSAIYVLDRLQQRRARAQRESVKALYGELMDELSRSLLYNVSEDDFDDWWLRTMRLTEATLGRGEQHWVMEPIPGGQGVSVTEEKRRALLKAMHLRLQDLMVRLDSMPIRDGFRASEWRKGPDFKSYVR